MPMGLANAPSIFQRMMNRIVSPLTNTKAYMDDILIHSGSEADHLDHHEAFFQRCKAEHIVLAKEKTALFKKALDYAGFHIGHGRVMMQKRLVEKIENFPRPTSIKENQSFLGLCNYYSSFIKDFPTLAAPLSDINGKAFKGDFVGSWTEVQEDAFQRLKAALAQEPVLVQYDPNRETRVETDASKIATGAILSQLHEDGKWHPVAYYGRKFNDAQRNNSTAEQETLAILQSLVKWKHLLQGRSFTVLTDNPASKYLQTKNADQLSSREIRWLDALAEFTPFEVQYRQGVANPGADALSRTDWDRGQVFRVLHVGPPAEDLIPSLEEILLIEPMLSLDLAVIGTFRSKAARERWMLQYDRACLKAPVRWRTSRPLRFETTSLAEVANRKRLPQAHVVLLADDKHLDLPACDRLLSRLPASTHVIHSAAYNGTCARATKSYRLASGLTVRTTLQVNPGTDLRPITVADLLRRSMPLLTIQALVEPPPGPALRGMGGSLEIPSVDPQEEDLYTLVQRAGEKDKAYQALVASPPKKHEVCDSLVWRIDPETDRVCLVVRNDVAVRQRLVDRVHADAHFGAQRTYEQCRQHFVWQGMKSYIIDFVRTCPRC
eukprot:scaffold568_cov347-Pavlova_lutheri.AAC.1